MDAESFFHVALKVEDLERSLGFYRNHCGAEVLERGYEAESEAETAVDYAALSIADKCVYLFDRAPYEAAGLVEERPTGFLHYGFVVDDVRAAHADLQEAGIEFLMSPSDFGDLRICFFEDPDGVVVELLEEL